MIKYVDNMLINFELKKLKAGRELSCVVIETHHTQLSSLSFYHDAFYFDTKLIDSNNIKISWSDNNRIVNENIIKHEVLSSVIFSLKNLDNRYKEMMALCKIAGDDNWIDADNPYLYTIENDCLNYAEVKIPLEVFLDSQDIVNGGKFECLTFKDSTGKHSPYSTFNFSTMKAVYIGQKDKKGLLMNNYVFNLIHTIAMSIVV